MTYPNDPNSRAPKGDHNRRLALDIDLDEFAVAAGITSEQLRNYEMTPPDGHFDLAVAQRVGETLERLEATLEPRVDNGGIPEDETRTKTRIEGSPVEPTGVGTYRP